MVQKRGFCITLLLSTIAPILLSAQGPVSVQNFGAEPRAYTQRQSFWTEFNLSGTISKDERWQYQMDYQYRRSSDASYILGGSNSPFKEVYQQVFRPWIHYWVVPKTLRFSLSPIGFWVTWTPGQETSIYKNKDGDTSGQSVYPEFRICPQITSFQNFGRVQFINRFRYEFRYTGKRMAADNNVSDFAKGFYFAPATIDDQSRSDWYGNNQTGRFRWQTRVQFPLGKGKTKVENNTWYINAWDELFIATGATVKNEKLLNQNRFVAMVGYRFNTAVPIKIEAGVTYQTVFNYNIKVPPTNPLVTYEKNNVENNTAYTIYIICDEFHKLFMKKKPQE